MPQAKKYTKVDAQRRVLDARVEYNDPARVTLEYLETLLRYVDEWRDSIIMIAIPAEHRRIERDSRDV